MTRILALLAALLASLLPSPAAMPNAPCEEPFVYEGAAVNAVILPYRSTTPRLSESGIRLTLLLQTSTLFALLPYGSIGVVRIVDRSAIGTAGCEPENIIAKVLAEKPGAKPPLRPGHGVVFLWGFLYEEADNIYVRSYLQFARRGSLEQISVAVRDRRLAGALPSQAFAFPPARFSRQELSGIEKEFQRVAVLHEEPRETAPATPLPLDPDFPFAYWIKSTKGEWMEVRPFRSGPSGWLRAGVELSQSPLNRKMPELSFLEGAVGYLMARGSGNVAASPAMISQAQKALERYEADSKAPGAGLAHAVGKTLRGGLLLASPSPQPDQYLAAHQRFREAVDLTPYDAGARHLEVLLRLVLADQGRLPWKPAEMADDFVQAAALDPQNHQVLRNLESFYRLLLDRPPGVADPAARLSPDEVRTRLARLQKVLQAKPAPRAD